MKGLALFLLSAALAYAQSRSPESWPLSTVFPRAPEVQERFPAPGLTFYGVAITWKNHAEYELDRRGFVQTVLPRDAYPFYEENKNFVMQSRDAVFVEETRIRICGHPALRFVLAYGDRRIEVHDVLLKIGGQLEDYLFVYDHPTAAPPSADAAAFFSGITRKAPPAAEPQAVPASAPPVRPP